MILGHIKGRVKGAISLGSCLFENGLFQKEQINFVTDNAAWAIHVMTTSLCGGLNNAHPGSARVITDPRFLRNKLIHFGTRDLWLRWQNNVHPSNKIVVTCLHGSAKDGPQFAESLNNFVKTAPGLSAIVTSTRKMEQRLIDFGIPSGIIHRIPLGVDCGLFKPPKSGERIDARKQLSIPDGLCCIGSFQKDGTGWGEGLEPKLIKGPDIFVETVIRINRKKPVFCLLTGPARGYVINRLKENGIPFAHHFVSRYEDIVKFYYALDLYIISSREEGGPLALVEGMSTGVPIITTAVGMAPEIIKHGENGMIADIDDYRSLEKYALEVIKKEELCSKIIINGMTDVSKYDWGILALRCYEEIYKPMLIESNR